MTVQADITTEQRLTIVKHLANGKDLDTVATLTRLNRSTVLDVANHHGYPSIELLDRARGLLEAKIERDHAPTVHPDAARIEREQRTTSRPAAGAPTPPAGTSGGLASLTKPDEIRALLNASKDHPSKRVQAAGERVLAAVDRLRDLIRQDAERHAEKRRQDAEKAAAKAEVERLEAQLRAAKAKLRRTGQSTSVEVPRDIPAATVARTVAKATGNHPCQHAGCDRSFDTSQARAMHQRRAHEGFDPNAVHRAAS